MTRLLCRVSLQSTLLWRFFGGYLLSGRKLDGYPTRFNEVAHADRSGLFFNTGASMFGWFRRRPATQSPEATLDQIRLVRLQLERELLIAESFNRDLIGDAASCAVTFRDCVSLVREQPDAAASLLHLQGRAWLNLSQILNALETARTPQTSDDQNRATNNGLRPE